jgi:transposase
MDDDLPVFIQALSGNASDKNHFREIVKEYGASLQEMWEEDKIWVWDSAVYSERNIKEISPSYRWITRVPETLSEAKELVENSDMEKMRSTSLDGYHLFSTEVDYGGVKQRWIVVFSEKGYAREKKTLEKKIEREKERGEKEVWHFSNHDFCSAEDGLKALRRLEKTWKYHRAKGDRGCGEAAEKRRRKGKT